MLEENLASIIYCQDGLAFRTAEPARLGRLQLLRTDGAGEDLGEDVRLTRLLTDDEVFDSVIQVVLDVEEL